MDAIHTSGMNDPFQSYHSTFHPEDREAAESTQVSRLLPPGFQAGSDEVFRIQFATAQYGPNHRVTLRTDIDGWSRDVHGFHDQGRWIFLLARGSYPKGLSFKFVLDGVSWMEGDNVVLTTPQDTFLNEDRVRFAIVESRIRHPFDRLQIREDARSQSVIRSAHDESVIHDVLVVGSGMGGGVLADALSDKGVRTLVLEAGGLELDSHVYNLPGDIDAAIARHQVGHWSGEQGAEVAFSGEVTMNLGGRSVFWSGLIPRMQPWELKHWPAEVSRWLVSEGYDQAERLMRKHVTLGSYQERLLPVLQGTFSSWHVENTPRASHQPEFRTPPTPVPQSHVVQTTGTFSTAELLLDSMATRDKGGSEHLRINMNHLVTHLEMKDDRVAGVVCHDLAGNRRRTYRARNYVLAAGSMESVRIALNSGLQKQHPLIGAGFTDHPAYYVGYDAPIVLPPGTPWEARDAHARIFLRPRAERTGVPFNVEIVINGRYWRERHADNDIQDHRLGANSDTTINLKFIFDHPLVEANRIGLGGESGRLSVRMKGMESTDEREKAVRSMARDLLRFFQAPQVDLDYGKGFFKFGWGGTPHHAGGSMRMGTGTDCVVNTDLRFRGCTNLYACDVSVFPHIPAANPSLTLSALALRLASHLKARIANR